MRDSKERLLDAIDAAGAGSRLDTLAILVGQLAIVEAIEDLRRELVDKSTMNVYVMDVETRHAELLEAIKDAVREFKGLPPSTTEATE